MPTIYFFLMLTFQFFKQLMITPFSSINSVDVHITVYISPNWYGFVGDNILMSCTIKIQIDVLLCTIISFRTQNHCALLL